MNSAINDKETSQADHRQNLRAPLIIQKIQVESDRPVFFGYSKNLSRSGLFIATTNPIDPGVQLDLEIPLPFPTSETLRCRCEVVWRRPLGKHLPFEPGMGLKFIDMPEDVARRIDDWIKSQINA
ncbi:PilZ domain-containing protein [Malonomonas rubra]|uniref:PilZ domain-containing protein n=1 Tax=Malonomonas rubra TaxID=57040 RepID=UPI0026E938C0|nr:PilZ domain-containing protein [Malonomonas rubra]